LNGSFSTEMAKRGVSRTNKGNEGRKFISYRFSENSQKEMITLPSVAHVTNIVAPSPLWEDIKNMVSYNLS
jgi:hypothetical protein